MSFVKMNALLLSRPELLRVTSLSVKGLASLQPFSQRPGKEVLPTDPAVKPFSDIPGPPSLPIIGNLLDYYRGLYDRQKPYETYSLFRKNYGPLVKENLFYGKTLVHVFHQRDLQKVYLSEKGDNRLPIRHSHKAMIKYRKSRKDLYDHIGVAASNGEEWLAYRRLFTEFTKTDNSIDKERPSVFPALEEIADDLIEYMKSNLDYNGEIPVFPALYYYTLEIIGMLIFGKRMGCFDQDRKADVTRFIQAVHDSHYAIHQTEHKPYILARKAYKTLEISQDYIAHYVLERMNYISELIDQGNLNAEPLDKTLKRDDLVIDVDNEDPVRISDCFLYLKLKDGMSRRMILPMAVDFFQGGIHSTAHTLAFALYHLATNPSAQQLLREDLVKFYPDKNEKMGRNVSRSRYPGKVIVETLRLSPPTIGTGRVLGKDLVLSGYHVPKGTQVILHHEVSSKSEEYYSEPLKFIPGRNNVGYVFNPFVDSSQRICMGKSIAITEMHMAVAKIFRNFEISYHHDKVGVVNYLVNEPDKPFKLKLKEVSDTEPQQGSTTEGDKSLN